MGLSCFEGALRRVPARKGGRFGVTAAWLAGLAGGIIELLEAWRLKLRAEEPRLRRTCGFAGMELIARVAAAAGVQERQSPRLPR